MQENPKNIYINGKKTNYTVDHDGRVFSHITDKYLIHIPDKNGYGTVNIYCGGNERYRIRVHRLVAIAFIPNPENLPVVNHIDANKLNNNVSNLEWTTIAGNTQHAKLLGLLTGAKNPNPKFGENHPKAILTEDEVIDICDRLMTGIKVTTLAKELSIHRRLIYDIYYKQSWRHISNKYDFPETTYKYSKKLKKHIRYLLRRRYSNNDIIQQLNLEKNYTVKDILRTQRKKLRDEFIVDDYSNFF